VIHVREGRKRSTFGSADPGLEPYAPVRPGEPPLEVTPAVEPGPVAEPATDDTCGSGARTVEVGTWVTVAGLGTLTAVVATGGGGSVGTVVGNDGTVTTGVETITVGTVGTGTVSPSAWPVSAPAASNRIVAAAALISQQLI